MNFVGKFEGETGMGSHKFVVNKISLTKWPKKEQKLVKILWSRGLLYAKRKTSMYRCLRKMVTKCR